MCKICQKFLSTVTDQTLSPTEVPSSPGWHIKNIVHTYIFLKNDIFDNKLNLGAGLDFICGLSSLLIPNGNK